MADAAFMQKHRLSETAFTRTRKLDFKTLITFLLNHRKGATQTELDHFFAGHLDDGIARRHITKSACIQARKHLSHEAFVELNQCFVHELYASKSKALKRWHGHRVCAVDGSQLRLPREAVLQERVGCQSAVPTEAKQTMGLASVYYDVLNKLVVDAQLVETWESERYCAAQHLAVSKENDLVLYDRGYNAFWMYAYHQELGRGFCMRARVERDKLARKFVESGKAEAFVTYTPNQKSRRQCDEMNLSNEPITLRLIRVDLPEETEVLITNLMDEKRYPAHEFKRLYHLRWGVEEFYKRLKHHQEIENLSGKSVLVVLQDFYAKILAGNLTASLVVSGYQHIEKVDSKSQPTYQINMAQAFAKMKQYQVKLWKLTGSSLACYLRELVLLISQFKEQVRPGRTFPRKVSKFNKRRYWMHYKCTL
jgi:IS4 transposase